MKIKNQAKFIFITLIFILTSHYLAVFPHEYAHSFAAWSLGYKSNPININYGGTSWLNLLLLFHIDENVNYLKIYTSGHHYAVAFIAFAGPGLANGLLFLASFFLLKNKRIQNHSYLFYFLFLFNLMNIGNFYDYVPIRTFTNHGDVAHFATGLAISPWYVYIIFGYIILFLIKQFFTKTLPLAYSILRISSYYNQLTLLTLCLLILFGFFALPGFFDYGPISFFLSATSFLIIPYLIFTLRPQKSIA